MSKKPSSIALYVLTLVITVLGIISLVNQEALEWHFIVVWVLSIIVSVVDLVMSGKKQD